MKQRERQHERVAPKPAPTPRSKRRRRKALRRNALILMMLMIIGFCCYIIWAILTPPAQPDAPVIDSGQEEEIPDLTDPELPDSKPQPKTRKPNYYTFLLAGTNDDYNTDTIMLGSVDAESNVVNVVSIPRDTMVDVSVSIKKINNAYGRKGMDELRKQVLDITGVYPDYYCLVNMEDFIEIVDVIGGVYFDVPYDMVHPDADEKFNINLEKGYQLLDGKKAIQLVRYRGTSASDYGRMTLQRDFLKAVVKKLVNEFSISQASDTISVISKSVKTNMPVKDMIWFYVNVARNIDFENSITFDTMPGTTTGKYNKQDYVYLSPADTANYISQNINPYTSDIRPEELHIIRLENDPDKEQEAEEDKNKDPDKDTEIDTTITSDDDD